MQASNLEIYRGKRVLVTGDTGFKGAWLCEMLLSLGAEVHGFAMPPPTRPALFTQLKLSRRLASHTQGDIIDLIAVKQVIRKVQPEFIFHLAAQPLVRLSYEKPIETYQANVMGTLHILEATRTIMANSKTQHPCSIVFITTDKCYENMETTRPYTEEDRLGGYDPYSCSKSCDELIISSYRRSFFNGAESPIWLATARAGNVIGGGDWARDRIIPDAIRAIDKGACVPVRNRNAIRPWQHVLDPLRGYLMLGAALYQRENYNEVSGAFNFGPDPKEQHTVEELVKELLKNYDGRWKDKTDPNAPHEAGILSLNIDKAKRVLGWEPHWNFATSVRYTAEWYASLARHIDPLETTQEQIQDYFEDPED